MEIWSDFRTKCNNMMIENKEMQPSMEGRHVQGELGDATGDGRSFNPPKVICTIPSRAITNSAESSLGGWTSAIVSEGFRLKEARVSSISSKLSCGEVVKGREESVAPPTAGHSSLHQTKNPKHQDWHNHHVVKKTRYPLPHSRYSQRAQWD